MRGIGFPFASTRSKVMDLMPIDPGGRGTFVRTALLSHPGWSIGARLNGPIRYVPVVIVGVPVYTPFTEAHDAPISAAQPINASQRKRRSLPIITTPRRVPHRSSTRNV